jgi:hypothetical protein
MPQLIPAPAAIPVPGAKIIHEYVGRVNTGEAALSIAHMRSPAGWSEPGQRPDFDEYTVVLRGTLRVEHEGGYTDVRGGQAILAQRSARRPCTGRRNGARRALSGRARPVQPWLAAVQGVRVAARTGRIDGPVRKVIN